MRLPLLFLAACATTSAEPRTDEGPIVIELFTSQGCSSCPPADAYINKLAHAGQLGGRALAPLTFHVDYWNDLGWADPYSSPVWTERQQGYARSLGDDRVYTPELVVAGGAGMVGSQVSRVERAVAAAPRQAQLAADARWQAAQVIVSATAPDDADVFVAIWQDGTHTKVLRGENQGETLPSDRVVRKLERVAAAGKRGEVTITLDGAWKPGGAVAFAQRGDRRIVGAKLLPIR
jgi:hypothetical protein